MKNSFVMDLVMKNSLEENVTIEANNTTTGMWNFLVLKYFSNLQKITSFFQNLMIMCLTCR